MDENKGDSLAKIKVMISDNKNKYDTAHKEKRNK